MTQQSRNLRYPRGVPGPSGSSGQDASALTFPAGPRTFSDRGLGYLGDQVSRRLLPCLFLLALACSLDRANLSFAALQLNQDLGFTK